MPRSEMNSLGNMPSLELLSVSGMPKKIPESCSQMSIRTNIQKMGYDAGLHLFHLVIEMVDSTVVWGYEFRQDHLSVL